MLLAAAMVASCCDAAAAEGFTFGGAGREYPYPSRSINTPIPIRTPDGDRRGRVRAVRSHSKARAARSAGCPAARTASNPRGYTAARCRYCAPPKSGVGGGAALGGGGW
jgi:hypothetical protein